jgi:serine phosphatase RsbU (regulator of sigma subunit)
MIPIHWEPMRLTYANKLMLLMTAVGVVVGLSVAAVGWGLVRSAHVAGRQAELKRMATAAAAAVPPEALQGLQGDGATPAGRRLQETIVRLATEDASSLVRVAFVLARSGPGEQGFDLVLAAGEDANPRERARKLLMAEGVWVFPREALREGQAREAVYISAEGVECYAAAGAVTDAIGSRLAWLGVQARRADLESGLVSLPMTLAMAGLVLVPVSGLAGYGLSRLATRRLREIQDGAERVARGDLKRRLAVTGDDELSAVAKAVNSTASMLQSLNLAKQVQQQLLPAKTPTIPGLDIAAVCVYSDQTGGDYYDFIPLGEDGKDGWAVLIADVTGHGVAAALLMATARSILRAQPLGVTSVSEFLTAINREFCRQAPEGRFMTMFLLVIEPDGRTLRWASAGHDPAIVFDVGRNHFAELAGHDLPLGVDADATYSAETGSIAADGQVMILGTDGIWECQNGERRMFGKEGLKRVIRKAAHEPAAEIGRQLLQSLDAFRGEHPQQDDVTFIVIRLGGQVLLERPEPGYVP